MTVAADVSELVCHQQTRKHCSPSFSNPSCEDNIGIYDYRHCHIDSSLAFPVETVWKHASHQNITDKPILHSMSRNKEPEVNQHVLITVFKSVFRWLMGGWNLCKGLRLHKWGQNVSCGIFGLRLLISKLSLNKLINFTNEIVFLTPNWLAC